MGFTQQINPATLHGGVSSGVGCILGVPLSTRFISSNDNGRVIIR